MALMQSMAKSTGLDELEWYPDFYQRIEIPTAHGPLDIGPEAGSIQSCGLVLTMARILLRTSVLSRLRKSRLT